MLARLWAAAKPQLDYLDLVVAAGLGLLFTVLGLLNVTTGDALTQAAIALLALLAFSILRERVARERMEQALERTVREVEHTLRDTQSDYPYHTRSLELRYDIAAPDGSLVHATKTRHIRFTRNNVVSITEYHKSDGTVDEHTIKGGPAGGYMKDLPRVRRLLDRDGRPVELVSLERLCELGDVMEIVTERTLRDSFKELREYVNVAVEAPTDEVVFHVTWPASTPPRALELVRSGGRASGEGIPLKRLERDGDGRAVLVETISDPQESETLTLFWDWEPHAAGDPA